MHIRDLHLLGSPDWDIVNRIQSEDWTLVTNNGRDFLKLYSRLNIHAGLVIIVPNVGLKQQRNLFRTALRKLGPTPDLVNRVAKINLLGELSIENLP